MITSFWSLSCQGHPKPRFHTEAWLDVTCKMVYCQEYGGYLTLFDCCHLEMHQRKEQRTLSGIRPHHDMISGTRDNPPYRGNFIERLYEKKLSLLWSSQSLKTINN